MHLLGERSAIAAAAAAAAADAAAAAADAAAADAAAEAAADAAAAAVAAPGPRSRLFRPPTSVFSSFTTVLYYFAAVASTDIIG